MDIKLLHHFPRDTVEQLLAAIPFYKTVKQQDPWQYELLLKHSRIVSARPGEVLLQRGEKDQWLYFLLKGRLAVYPGDRVEGAPVNFITPGEVFGDLAMLVDRERTATVVADPNSPQVLVFGTDFKAFGALEDFSVLNLQTKLIYYHNSVLSLRWKLEVYRSQHPQSPLAGRHLKVKLYTGAKGTLDELRALNEQAQALARLLIDWNQEFGALNKPETEPPSGELLAALDA